MCLGLDRGRLKLEHDKERLQRPSGKETGEGAHPSRCTSPESKIGHKNRLGRNSDHSMTMQWSS